ncbi:MAG: serine/threonine protein kinase, partial [Planctomycetota bacterium]
LVIELLRQLCSALEEAHARGIVHHDLTPRNIMVEATPSGFRAKVLDFGIARLAGQDPSETASEELSELWVNPPFTAPEVLSRQPADEASDFYSLGVVAYVALSGRLPHGGTTLKERVQQVIEEDPEPLKVQRGTPRRLIQLIGALTSKDPAGRPSSIAAVREELQRLQQPMGFLARAVCVLVFIAGFSLLMVQLAARPALYLKTSNRDPELTLSEAWPRSEIQVVRMEDLSSLELEAGGFSASELLVEISRPSQGSSRSVRLYGQLVDGYLSFDEKRDESWASFLEELGKELDEGPGDLSLLFRHSPAGEKGEPLAYARILVDREPPAIKVENLEPGNVLRIRTALRISVEDDVGTTGIEYWIKALDKENTILDKGRQEIAEKSFELEIGKLFTSEELQSFDGPLVFGCRAEDRAHRTTLESERIWFQRGADLFIPEIEQAGNRRFEPDLRIVKNQIEVALGLSAPEEKLRVHLRVKKNDEWVDVPDPGIETDGSTLRLSWDLPRGQADSALYEFQLEDRVGNLSLPKSFRFDFVNLDPRAKFNVVSGLARLLEDPPRLFIGREPVTIEYFCNEIFRPEAEIVNAGKLLVKFSSHEVSLGHCRLTLEPPSRAVSFQIKVLHIFEESTGARSELEYGKASLLEVSVLPDPPAIETVAELVGGRSWTPELIEKGVLHQELDGGDLSLGRGIKIHLAGEHAVAGALWVFRNGSWQEEKRVPDLKTALIRGEIPVDPQHGSNRYALEARDILGRHLVDRRAGSEPDEQGRIVFADFRHDETAPEPPEQ